MNQDNWIQFTVTGFIEFLDKLDITAPESKKSVPVEFSDGDLDLLVANFKVKYKDKEFIDEDL